MYTVIRFVTDSSVRLDELSKIGDRMEVIKSGTYTGIRKAGDGFACLVSDASDHTENFFQVENFVSIFDSEIAYATEVGFYVSVDIAFEPKDYGEYYGELWIKHEVLSKLAALKVNLTITCYKGE